MIDFKDETIDNTANKPRVNNIGVYIPENSGQLHLNFHNLIEFQTNMDDIKEKLHPKKHTDVINVYSTIDLLNRLGNCSEYPNTIEQLDDEDLERIFSFSNIDNLRDEYKSEELINLSIIQKTALENIFYILKNSEICNSLQVFTRFDFAVSIVHQLPNLHVPLILSILFDFNPSLADQISSEIPYLVEQFEDSYQKKFVDIYSVVQVLSLAFQYDAVPIDEAARIVQRVNEVCWRNRENSFIDCDLSKFFCFDFLRKLHHADHLSILSETNFFSQVAKYFTTLSIFVSTKNEKNRPEFQLRRFFEQFNVRDESVLNERGMTTRFTPESLRSFALEVLLNYVESGFIENFVISCFPALFNNFAIAARNNDDLGEKMVHLNTIIAILHHVIEFSEECRSALIQSEFHKLMQNLPSFNEKVAVVSYLRLFIDFDVETLNYLSAQFDIPSLCSDLLLGENEKGIVDSIDIFSLVLRSNEPDYLGEPAIKGLLEKLMESEVVDSLEELLIESENEEIQAKSQELIDFIKAVLEDGE